MADLDQETPPWESQAASQPESQGETPPWEAKPEEPKLASNRAMKAFVQANLAQHYASLTENKDSKSLPVQQTPAEGFADAFKAGLQLSTSGLALRGKMPDTVLPEHASRAMNIASQIGQLAGDLPAMVAGGMFGSSVGAGAGAAAGTAIAPGLGTVAGTAAGATIGASAGAFALPATLRKIMMDHYEKGDITTAADFWDRLSATTWEAIKGATTGAATAAVGGPVAEVAGPLVGLGAELATMTTVGSAVEGHMPNADDFINGAIVLGGLHAAGSVSGKLRNIYATTGAKPEAVVDEAQRNVELKQQLLSEDPSVPVDQESAAKPLSDQTAAKSLSDQKPAENIPQRTDAENEVLSKIGEKPEAPKKSVKEYLNDFYTKNVDYLHTLDMAEDDAVKNGAEIPLERRTNTLGRLLAAHMDTVRGFVEHGTRDWNTGEINGEGLTQILNDLPKDSTEEKPDLDGFRAFAMASRGLELWQRPSGEGKPILPWKDFNPDTAQEVVDAGEKKFGPYLQRTTEYQNRVLDYTKDAGLFSEDSVKAMKEANTKYVPFYRLMDPDTFTGSQKSGAGGNLKRIFGSEKELIDPIESMYRNTEVLIRKALVNEARGNFVENMRAGNLLQEDDGLYGNANDKYLEKVPNKLIPTTIDSETLSKALEKQGIEADPESITTFRSEQSWLKPNQIAIYEDGVRKVYEGPPGVIDSLKRMEGDKTMTDMWSKFMAGFAKSTRIGVTLDPTFGFRHFFRSQTMSGIYSQTGMIPFYHPALAMKEFMEEGPRYQQWLYDGGAVSSWDKLDTNYLQKNLQAYEEKAPVYGQAWNGVKTAAQASEAFIRMSDNLARFTEYNRALDQGKSRTEAAFLSREVTPDYQKAGLERSVLRTGVAFIGAHINSLDRMAQAIKEDPKGTLARASVIGAMSAALWAVNKDDDAIQSLPDWQKDTYWNFNVSKMFGVDPNIGLSREGSSDKNAAMILRLPKPWSMGILFGSGIERTLDAFNGSHPDAVKNFTGALLKSVIVEPIPNMVAPVLEQYANRNLLTGRPLVSADKEKLLPEMQYEPYTAESAKQLAKVIGYVPLVRDIGPSNAPLASPAIVESYIRAWGGSLGGIALRVADSGLRAAGIGNQETHSADTLADAPFLNTFLSRYPSLKEQDIQNFYENVDKTTRVLNSIQYAAKQGDMDAALKISQAHPDLELKLTGIAKGIGTAKKVIQDVQNNPDMKPIEKRQLIDTMLFQIGSMAKTGNQMMENFKKINDTKSEGN